MPEFLEDPSVLTKDRLKSELLANNVTLPAGEQRKDVYVQLYLQHLTARNRPPPPPPAQPRPPAPATNSRAPPDFSSDDEREPTPVLSAAGRGRGGGGAAAGRKATKKTDKPRSEEKDDFDVTELTNEELLSQLVKYGVNPGPIVGTTRKLYEKKLLKLREHGPDSRSSTPLPAVSSSSENARQNGNNDSDRYSDNEEELKLEKREPLKGKIKTPVTLKQRRVEHNQNYSQAGLTETLWTSGSSKSGRLQGLTREPTRGSRRTPRKRVETTEQLRVDGEVISESLPIAETIMASSNETLVVNRVTGNFKHAAPILPISEFSDIPRRTPKKPLTRAEVGEITLTEDRRIERDILKEMFPFEAATPTGISASCRRPIKGAAGRPLELGDFRMEGTFSSKYVPKYAPLADDKTERKGRSIPMWIKILLFVIVAVFLFLVYQAMETNQGNPFSHFLSDKSTNNFQAKAN